MKGILKVIGALLALFVAIMVLQFIASETGEVVVVTTTDAEGASAETRLWVVDHDGSAWLRSGSPQAGWFQRMQANPAITVERGGQQFTALIEPVPELRDVINAEMAEKYGWADAYIGMLFGRDDAVPIRLRTDAAAR